MRDRELLVFLLLVAGAVYVARNYQMPAPQISGAKDVERISPAPDNRSVDAQGFESSQAASNPQNQYPPQTAQALLGSFTPRQMFVGASRVNVRASPGKIGKLVAQLPAGTELQVLAVNEGWSQIKTRDGKVAGWISSNFLTSRKVVAPKKPVSQPTAKPPAPAKLVPAAPNRKAVIEQIIASSIQNYSGSCPCPYNTMRNGRRCGGRSAYSNPGGESPICYPEDVTDEMIRQWANR